MWVFDETDSGTKGLVFGSPFIIYSHCDRKKLISFYPAEPQCSKAGAGAGRCLQNKCRKWKIKREWCIFKSCHCPVGCPVARYSWGSSIFGPLVLLTLFLRSSQTPAGGDSEWFHCLPTTNLIVKYIFNNNKNERPLLVLFRHPWAGKLDDPSCLLHYLEIRKLPVCQDAHSGLRMEEWPPAYITEQVNVQSRGGGWCLSGVIGKQNKQQGIRRDMIYWGICE